VAKVGDTAIDKEMYCVAWELMPTPYKLQAIRRPLPPQATRPFVQMIREQVLLDMAKRKVCCRPISKSRSVCSAK
jgi:hypothetical protein